ncbi:MAG: DUF4359 domain-containing protein, partial [Nitrospirae bacterium]|nr:DUF4359 domain-containing protein [Nitrospirota bacterium]
ELRASVSIEPVATLVQQQFRAGMSLLRLSLVVTALAVSVALALTNPTTDQYLGFVQAELAKAMDRMDQSTPEREGTVVRNIFRRHSQELLNSMVRPHTIRQNWGVLSRFETTVLGTRVVVIGIGSQFIPVEGVDEAVLTLGRHVF